MEINKTNTKIKDMLDAQMSESGLSVEEIVAPTMLSFVYMYFNSEIEDDEILYISDKLGYECDLSLLKQEKNRQRNKAYAE